MATELLSYSEGDDAFDAFIARPNNSASRHRDAGPWPAVLICHAWGGRGELEHERARQLAELGWLAAAIDLYGVGRRGHADRAASAALMSELTNDPPLLRRRLTAAFQAVRTLADVDPDRMGMIGYCFGGMCALLGARMGLPLRGVVSFHGLLKIGEPLDARVRARVLVLHGQDDPMVPVADIAAFAAEMQRLHVDWQLHAYPHVMHAFTNPQANDPSFGTVYDAEADRRSWAEMRGFFSDVFDPQP
jgi:dienelactone hydrolase